jgi:hypothetical protein
MSREEHVRGRKGRADGGLTQLESWGWHDMCLLGELGAVLLACPSEARQLGETGDWRREVRCRCARDLVHRHVRR